MKTILSTIAATALIGTAAIAGGDIAPVEVVVEEVVEYVPNFYVGAGVAAYTTYLEGEKDFFNDNDLSEVGGGLEGKIGYTFFRTGDFKTSIEGQLGKTMWSYGETFADFGDMSRNEMEMYNIGAYLKPEYNFTDSISAYALLGYARTEIKDDNFKLGENGFSYGVGLGYAISDSVSLYGEYVMLPELELFNVDAGREINLESDKAVFGVTYSF